MSTEDKGITVPAGLRINLTRETLERGNSIWRLIAGSEHQRKSHLEHDPISEIEQEAQRIWLEQYEAIAERGRQRGWLIEDYDGTYLADIQTTRSRKVYDETEEEHAERTKDLPQTVSFPVVADPHVPGGAIFVGEAEE